MANFGVPAQRIDPFGLRAWTDDGVTLAPLTSAMTELARVVPGGALGGSSGISVRYCSPAAANSSGAVSVQFL
ncbi:MAG: hypothetical protein R3F49_08135 [Planctomycetota bacterium]